MSARSRRHSRPQFIDITGLEDVTPRFVRGADGPVDPRRAYRVVDDFEDELSDYTNSPHVVTVDSATNAIFLSLLYERLALQFPPNPSVTLPRRTYVGVLQAARNAGWRVRWDDTPWVDRYRIAPTRVVDSARHFARDMYVPGTLAAVSFHVAKQLPLGRGGAILTDDKDAADWLRRARADGRAPGDTPPYALVGNMGHCYMPPPTAALGLWILSRWADSEFSPAPLGLERYPDLSTLEDA